jgi:hypothetical protein
MKSFLLFAYYNFFFNGPALIHTHKRKLKQFILRIFFQKKKVSRQSLLYPCVFWLHYNNYKLASMKQINGKKRRRVIHVRVRSASTIVEQLERNM